MGLRWVNCQKPMALKIPSSIQSFRQIFIFVNHGTSWNFFSYVFKIIFQKSCFSSFFILPLFQNCDIWHELLGQNQPSSLMVNWVRFSPSGSPCTSGFNSSCNCILPVSYLSKCGVRQWVTGLWIWSPHRTLEIPCRYCFLSQKKKKNWVKP